MSMLRKDGNFPSTSCATSQEAKESSFKGQPPISALKVTLLSSEWRSTKGGLSTINRKLAIHLAKHSNVEVSMYLPQCSEEDKRAAASHNVCIIEAEEIPGYDPIYWLATIPRDHQMDFVIGHGIHLGRQVPHIKRVHQGCKWIQVVHTDPEELGMLKNYADSFAKGEKKHQAEVGLCKLADQVVAIGPRLQEAFSRYLRSCGKDQDVLNLTPGIFSEFADVPQAAEERGSFRVLVFGRGDIEDFKLKGYDIAARAVAELCKHEPHCFKLAFVGAPKGEEEKVKELLLKESIASSQLSVRSYKEREQLAAQFCEADLAIMPSRTEGFGLAALEALSAGLPVLVSGNCGIGDALKKLPFGSSCVVNSEDASEWAKAIRAVHDKKRKLRLREAVKLREGYAEEYQWDAECGRLVERMLNIIQVSSEGRSVVKQGRRPLYLHPSTTPPVKEQRRDAGIRRVLTHNSNVVEYLRAEYERRAQLRPLFWVNTMQLPLEKVYTRLKIVSRQTGGNQGETDVFDDIVRNKM
ncbi:PREDICTED: D-inositol 3-phosphate glycosyltransferase 1-like [Acropora digitifera]|uniref:D-inositol 3-phosphate glycosyltransferase 1-like n=1 Tax=Acropora digitifera TaxID=70779 RepID=UPI00077AC211|nr:PREDICTED: D-inositol 3-phosphate glycosyltransferase 1-like [Acropora digitifera]